MDSHHTSLKENLYTPSKPAQGQNVSLQVPLQMMYVKTPPTLRQGDWICYYCSNLNFSFRDVCNRCKCSTRHSSSPAPGYYYPDFQSSSFQSGYAVPEPRNLLNDIQNTMNQVEPNIKEASQSKIFGFSPQKSANQKSIKGSARKEKQNSGTSQLAAQMNNTSAKKNKTNSKAFASALLLTPPKQLSHRKHNISCLTDANISQDVDSFLEEQVYGLSPYQQKSPAAEGSPYRSPGAKLPNVSPLLKKINDSHFAIGKYSTAGPSQKYYLDFSGQKLQYQNNKEIKRFMGETEEQEEEEGCFDAEIDKLIESIELN